MKAGFRTETGVGQMGSGRRGKHEHVRRPRSQEVGRTREARQIGRDPSAACRDGIRDRGETKAFQAAERRQVTAFRDPAAADQSNAQPGQDPRIFTCGASPGLCRRPLEVPQAEAEPGV